MDKTITLKYTDFQGVESGNNPTLLKEILDKIADGEQVYIVVKDGKDYKVAKTDKGIGLVPV
jgi:hypothetical protein